MKFLSFVVLLFATKYLQELVKNVFFVNACASDEVKLEYITARCGECRELLFSQLQVNFLGLVPAIFSAKIHFPPFHFTESRRARFSLLFCMLYGCV